MPPKTFSIPKHERFAVTRMFVYCVMVAASYTATRTAADSLFLSRAGTDNLALIFLCSGLLTAFLAMLWVRLTEQLPLQFAMAICGVVLSLVTAACWWLLTDYHHSFVLLAAIYLLADVKGCLNAINIISVMNENLGGHASRHSWAAIGLGVPIAGIAVGISIGTNIDFVDLHIWMLIAAILDLTAWLALIPGDKTKKLKVPNHPRRPSLILNENNSGRISTKPSYACPQQFARWIGILVAAKIIVITIITFEWKISVHEYFVGNEHQLARFFGIFYASIGVVTIVIQLLLTGRILTRHGPAIPILLMPVAFLFINTLYIAGTGIAFLLLVTTAAKSMESWRRSIYDTTLSLLYTNLNRDQRRPAIAFNSAVVKPLAEVFASIILLLGGGLVYKSTIYAATLIWIVAAIMLLRLIRPNRKRKSDLRIDERKPEIQSNAGR